MADRDSGARDGGATDRTPVSIVCVSNDAEVLGACLRRSVEAGRLLAPQTELIIVDSRGGQFETAGAALNQGAAGARHPVVVFAHQDVYLHSLPDLERAANELVADPSIGVMGAVGIDSSGRIIGRIRDRVIGLGAPAPAPRDVESMDEVLFMVERERLLREPVADAAPLSWHAYAVEYSARMRAAGLRAVVRDIPLTHNSLTANLRHLDVAHRWVGSAYPQLLPLMTTCGTIDPEGRDPRRAALARRARGLARWERESRAALGLHGHPPAGDIVLADVRFAIDELAARAGSTSIRSLDRRVAGVAETAVLGIERFGRPTSAATVDRAAMSAAIAERRPGELLLLANLDADDLATLDLGDAPRLIGFSEATGLWIVVGMTRSDVEAMWTGWRSRPYGGLLGVPAEVGAALRRGRGALSALFFGLLADATSLLPPKWRYSYVHPLTRVLLPSRLPKVSAPPSQGRVRITPDRTSRPADLVCALVVDELDVGGIGAVVETLALGLGEFGVGSVVICRGDGTRARRLRELGVQVISVSDDVPGELVLRDAGVDVIQVHSAPSSLETAAITSGLPLTAVLHNTEIHYTRREWERFTDLYSRAAAAVAVSSVVEGYHLRHLPPSSPNRFSVIPNGAPDRSTVDPAARRTARARLGAVVGQDLGDAVVFICLARYDAQKNIAGSVASFLLAAATTGLPIHLVVAGEPSDRVELRRADGIRRRSRHADRVHLLADSDAGTLLDAGDAFLLDSFFEGWSVAATEALGAGLPLVLSDVGGAEELVSRDPGRSRLVPNATGRADAVTDARVASARRRSTRQVNRRLVAEAIVAVAGQVVQERSGGRTVVARDGGVRDMVEQHATLLRQIARSR
jgi:glycosyltransferase involved in cell wall biosynthesis